MKIISENCGGGGREAALTRELSPLIAKLYELDPVKASADTDAIIQILQDA